MFWPPKMSHSFIQNCCWITASFASSTMIDVSKPEGKTNFWGAYRLSGTGIVDCLEIIDVGCNLKQFDGLTRLTLTPIFYHKSTPLSLSPCTHNSHKIVAVNDRADFVQSQKQSPARPLMCITIDTATMLHYYVLPLASDSGHDWLAYAHEPTLAMWPISMM